MATARSCLVSFTDSSGVQHSVEVVAASLYEAAVLAVAEFRRCPLMEAEPGIAAMFTVTVKPPAPIHQVKFGQVKAWVESAGKSPSEHLVKVRLREILNK